MAKSYDLMIRGGRLIDGTGAPARAADVAIRGEGIADVGKLEPAAETPVLEASGLTVAPGFIDAWGAADPLAPAFPGAETKLLQGVTTEVAGAGSRFPFPLAEGATAPLEGIGADLIVPDWTDARGFLLRLARATTAIHRAVFAGYGQIRAAVIGPSDSRPTRDEVRRIAKELEGALEAGCVGLSVELSTPPASFAGAEQVVELGRVLADADAVLALGLRDVGRGLEAAVDEAIEIASRTGVELILPALRVAPTPYWGKIDRLEETFARALDEGVHLAATVEPYCAWAGSLSALFPQEMREGSPETVAGRLKSPRTREAVGRAREARAAGDPEYWTRIRLVEPPGSPTGKIRRSASGRAIAMIEDLSGGTAGRTVPLTSKSSMSVAEVALARNHGPAETLVELVEADPGRDVLFFEMSEANVERILAWDFVTIGSGEPARPLSDARVEPSIHPRARGTFPRVLRRYVRDKKRLTLEEAIRRMTSLAADRLKLGRRGRVEAGCMADLVLMSSEGVADRATFGDPTVPPTGIEHVIVAGRFAVRNGVPTGTRSGQVVRRG